MIVRHGPFLWIDLVERTSVRAAMSLQLVELRLHCAKLQAAKESDSLVCEARPGETVPVSQPSPSVSHLISFYSNLLVSLFFSLPPIRHPFSPSRAAVYSSLARIPLYITPSQTSSFQLVFRLRNFFEIEIMEEKRGGEDGARGKGGDGYREETSACAQHR